MLKFFLISCLVVAALGAEIGVMDYQGYQVLTVTAENKEQFDALHKLFVSDAGIDFWTHPQLGDCDIMVNQEQFEILDKIMQTYGMKYKVKIPDVARLVSEERIANNKANARFEGRMNWDAYQRWSVVEPWLESLSVHPHITVNNIGTTYEGRTIRALRITNGDGAGKPAVFIDALFHAREWISGAVCTYIVNELATKPDTYKAILDKVDIHVVPFTNIDGYEYSHTNQRLWRKTRKQNVGSTCFGVDPNRNFEHYWGGESTSTNPCSDIFIGEEPFSEPETRAVKDYILKQIEEGVDFISYITIHSYGQLWLLPWGHTQNTYPPDFAEIKALGDKGAAALTAHYGTRYTVAQGADSLYAVGGASDDWAKFYANVKYSFTLELRDTGTFGFSLPPNQLMPTAIETWSGVQVVLHHVGDNYSKA
jgi:murein tripeptide amidase MpaA